MDISGVLLLVSILFTVGVLLSLFLIIRQTLHSRWIDSRSFIMAWILFGVVFSLLGLLWVSYFFYIGMLS